MFWTSCSFSVLNSKLHADGLVNHIGFQKFGTLRMKILVSLAGAGRTHTTMVIESLHFIHFTTTNHNSSKRKSHMGTM